LRLRIDGVHTDRNQSGEGEHSNRNSPSFNAREKTGAPTNTYALTLTITTTI